MKLLKHNKRKNKGFTLIEILLVVGFIALAGIGIYTVYSKVQVSNQANSEGRNLDALRAGIKSMYGGTNNYATLTNIVVNNARITPDSMRPDGSAGNGDIVNSFGGVVEVAPTKLGNGGGASNAFSITYNNVPGAVCSKLVASAGVQFNEVVVDGTKVKDFTKANEPLDIAAVASSCNQNDVQVVFTSL